MKVHAVTSLNRFHNLPRLLPIMRSQGVHWHVVIDDSYGFSPSFHEPWITGYCAPIGSGRPFWMQCHSKLNWWMDNYNLCDDDYYCFPMDDDSFEPGLFDVIRQQTHGVVIVSLKRGHRIPEGVEAERAHGTETLIATPENMRIGSVSFQQLFVKGSLLRTFRIPLSQSCGDGEFIINIVNKHGAKYLSDNYAWFNYLEPGRWD